MQPHNAVGVQLSQVAVYQHHKAQLQSLAGSCCETPDPLRAFTVKLCDFGAALVNTGGPGAPAVGITPRGTSRFCSPQVMSGLLNRGVAPGLTTLWAPAVHPDIVRTCATSYDAYAADVWSFGVTLFALVAGREPFQAAGPQCAPFRSFVRFTQPEALGEEVMCPQSDVWHKDVDAPSPPSWCWPDCFSPALVHLLGGCLRVREGERFSMEEVAAHPWFKNPSWVPLPQTAPVEALPVRFPSLSDLEAEAESVTAVGSAAARQKHGCGEGPLMMTPVPPLRLKQQRVERDDAFSTHCASARLALLGTGDAAQAKGVQGGSARGEDAFARGRKLVSAGLHHMHTASGSRESGPRVVFHHSMHSSGDHDPLATGLSLDTLGGSFNSIAVHGSRESSEANDVVLA